MCSQCTTYVHKKLLTQAAKSSASNFTDPSVFLRESCAHYGQKYKNTEENSAPGSVASITTNGEHARAVRITFRKLRKNSSLCMVTLKFSWRHCKRVKLSNSLTTLKVGAAALPTSHTLCSRAYVHIMHHHHEHATNTQTTSTSSVVPKLS